MNLMPRSPARSIQLRNVGFNGGNCELSGAMVRLRRMGPSGSWVVDGDLRPHRCKVVTPVVAGDTFQRNDGLTKKTGDSALSEGVVNCTVCVGARTARGTGIDNAPVDVGIECHAHDWDYGVGGGNGHRGRQK